MGLLTDFFVASEAELKAAFPTWVPVADKPQEVERVNPFTGKAQKVRSWVPAAPFPSKKKGGEVKENRPAFRKLPQCQFKRVDTVKLAKLQHALCGGKFETTHDEIVRPALLCEGDGGPWLHQLPKPLVAALAAISSKKDLDKIAKQWSETEEARADGFKTKDCAEVIQSLSDLAKRAIKDEKNLYLWVSL
jgi:hypothetical protein